MASFQFGETVEGYAVPVLNEREIRAAAGILFVFTFLALLLILLSGKFLLVKLVIPVFLADLLVRVFVSPRYSPTLILGRLIVADQAPEYVAAKPKQLAWAIGIVLSSLMFVFMVVMNTYSPITGITCLVCLVFLFFEAAFGICLGCKFYKLVFREEPQLCPGEVCDVRTRDAITRTSGAQWAVLLVAIAVIVGGVLAFSKPLSKPAHALFPAMEPKATAKH
ncbi:MAG: DUF4395 domain-containing protein [Candidatus Eisenbacteria bacterium]